MAHWAEIDENNLVIRVLVFGDDKTKTWIKKRFGGTWIQTSYSGAFRKSFAGIGSEYLPDDDAFRIIAPFGSWTWNAEQWDWEAPTPMPEDGKRYRWDEETISWVEIPETSE